MKNIVSPIMAAMKKRGALLPNSQIGNQGKNEARRLLAPKLEDPIWNVPKHWKQVGTEKCAAVASEFLEDFRIPMWKNVPKLEGI